jgi:hypothetical protein
MNTWLNQNCPGFMIVERKPHPSGNEYHSIADGDDGKPIMWRIKIQEGKDRPKKADGTPAFPSAYEKESKTVKLMLEMTVPLQRTGKIVTMDSGFCVTVGILALHDKGIYGQALIKKRGRYWPRGVPGNDINNHFQSKELGSYDCFVQEKEGKNFLIHCHKEDKYVCKIMSTHGRMEETDREAWRLGKDGWSSFKYTEAITNHNIAKHWVDDVNNRRHAPIGLQDIWATKWWPHRQFTFICSVAEVNANNSQARALKEPAKHQIVFRKQLAKEMMYNRVTDSGGVRHSPIRAKKRSRESMEAEHMLKTKPTFTGAWDAHKKQFNSVKSEYLKQKCKTCTREIRTYCICSKGVPMCSVCYGVHCFEVRNTI